MKTQWIKVIAIFLGVGFIYYLGKNYPEYVIIGSGILLVILVGSWIIKAEKDAVNNS